MRWCGKMRRAASAENSLKPQCVSRMPVIRRRRVHAFNARPIICRQDDWRTSTRDPGRRRAPIATSYPLATLAARRSTSSMGVDREDSQAAAGLEHAATNAGALAAVHAAVEHAHRQVGHDTSDDLGRAVPGAVDDDQDLLFHRCSPRRATTRSRRRPIRRSSLYAGMTTLRSPLPWPTAFAASPRTHVMPSARDGDGIRADAVAMPSPDVQSPTVAWFAGARFGLFIHWGHGSQRGWELSWPLVGGVRNLRHCQDVPAEAYHANARTFAPRPGAAREWLAAARRCGMRYAVFTAKHHDGFALFPSRVSDFSIAATPY